MVNRLMSRLLPALVLCGVLCAAPLQAQVVVSQVYGGGGNSGAPWSSDFVELFNRGGEAVPLSGLSLQYASATGTGNLGAGSGQIVVLPAVTLEPGRYFLVGLAGGANGGPLPAPDATGTINMSGRRGQGRAGRFAVLAGLQRGKHAVHARAAGADPGPGRIRRGQLLRRRGRSASAQQHQRRIPRR